MPVLSSKVSELRNQLGWTQGQLAARATIGRRTVQKAELGNPVSQSTLELIADALGVEADELIRESKADVMQDGPWKLGQFVRNQFSPSQASFASSADEIIDAISMMMKTIDRVRFDSSPKATRFRNAITSVWDHESTEEICSRYVNLWKFDQRAVMFAVEKNERVGISTVMPLKRKIADAFIDGRKGLFELDAHCLECPSQSLFLDSNFEFPNKRKKNWFLVTSSLFRLLLWQMTVFSDKPMKQDFRLISVAGNPEIAKRLDANGFVETGAVTRAHKFPIFVLDSRKAKPFSTGRRNFMKGVLASYKYVVNPTSSSDQDRK